MKVRLTLAACAALLALGYAQTGAPRLTVEEQLARHRNLGKAFYENPTTQLESVTEFRRALALSPASIREKLNLGLAYVRAANNPEGLKYLEEVQRLEPKLPHTWFNLGIHWKKQGEAERAITQFREFVKLAPAEPKAHYNLGAALKLGGQNEEAVQAFERAAQLDPLLAAARFQLYNGYRLAGRMPEAQAALREFQRLKKEQEGAAIPEDVDWCDYAEIYDPVPQVPDTPAVPKYQYRDLAPGAAFVLAFDAYGEGRPSLLVGLKDRAMIYRYGAGVGAPLAVAGAFSAAAGDFNNDGSPDLVLLADSGTPRLFRNTRGMFSPVKAAWPDGRFRRAVWLDYDHDYDLDLFLFGERSVLLRNSGAAGFEEKPFPFVAGEVEDAAMTRVNPESRAFDLRVDLTGGRRVVYRDKLGGVYEAVEEPRGAALTDPRVALVDFNSDGRLDRAEIAPTGVARVGLDMNTAGPRWIRVALEGVRNLKRANDAFVEVKAGSLYKRARYDGLPLLFTVGTAAEVDVVRITWPNGLIQNETKLLTNRGHAFKEAQRLSGSCPIIWTWDGAGFRYITDVLGVAPLGASDGEGTYFATDHDEYVQIPGEALKAVDGRYEIRVTEELSEAAYLDRVALVAVDHPASVEVFTNEKWKAPPFPEFRLFPVARRQAAVKAVDHNGADVTAKVARRDKTYPAGFVRTMSGVAEKHFLTLDFGREAAGDLLVMHGWVDWADGSTFRQVAQEKQGGLQTPSLQVRDGRGQWVTVIEDMGMPAGKPKTIVVDLTGKWLSASREVRVVTSLCVYWDEIFLAADARVETKLTAIAPVLADLRFRGFSPSKIHPERAQPEEFTYEGATPTSLWDPTPGRYTRYGDVRPLLAAAEDRMVVMGSGDELRLLFDPAALPPVEPGMARDFLLRVDGWAKDRDANTVEGHVVQPLPYRSMRQYPPEGGHPQAAYEREWNTRPALRLLRSLR